jgi:hypothetical protein
MNFTIVTNVQLFDVSETGARHPRLNCFEPTEMHQNKVGPTRKYEFFNAAHKASACQEKISIKS